MTPQLVSLTQNEVYGVGVIDWLLERKEALPSCLVVVPTAQSSRRLRQGLAERGGLLAPKMMTAGSFFKLRGAASDALEVLAWTEALEAVEDWSEYSAIFPSSPAVGGAGWAMGLARAFVDLRKSLQENGLMLASAASMVDTLESQRWDELARLERVVERHLRDWESPSKSSLIEAGELNMPDGVSEVVIAGVLDLPQVVTRYFERGNLPVSVLVSDERVDSWGRPDLAWNEREIVWPEVGEVALCGDPQQQAELAVARVMEGGRECDEIGLGTADEEVAPELVRSFGRAGWVVHDPGASLPSSLAGWLGAWKRYLASGGVKEVIDMLAFDQGRALVSGIRSQQVEALSVLRDSYLVRSGADVTRARLLLEEGVAGATSESQKNRMNHQLESAKVAESVMEEFASLRKRFQGQGFHAGTRSLLSKIDRDDEAGLDRWLEETSGAAKVVNRSPSFWVDLLLLDLTPEPEEAPEGRVTDVQGWLEFLHDSAKHLVICGMNEGRVPMRASPDSWLPESARKVLGLPSEESRAARDAYLLHAILEMRRVNGRVDLMVGKSSIGGDVLMPSRLLLTAKGELLASRVKELFAEVEPADSGVAWELEEHWKWRARKVEPKSRMSVTAFSKYLACPFRYYLQRVVGMNVPEPERVEWNARDFGNIMHEVLEQWGRDLVVRDSADEKVIENWLLKALDELVERHFGEELPLAVALQLESMRLRLGWFAEVQAQIRAEGWRIVEVEKNFELPVGSITVTGQVDRIEKNDDGRVRVLDYKTSKEAKDVVREHQRKFRNDPPVHLQGDEVKAPNGAIWTNLQVPFYAHALGEVDAVGYFALGQDRYNVKITPWVDFDETERESALKCAEWIVSQVEAEVFWPPAEKVTYDDLESLAFGREIEKSFSEKGMTR